MNFLSFFPILFIFLIIIYLFNSHAISEREIDMVVVSKDKTKLAEYNRFAVERNLGCKKEQKFVLYGCLNQYQDILNLYPTKEEAVKALDTLFEAYKNGVRIYEF